MKVSHAELDQRLERRAGRLAVGAGGVDGREHVGRLGPGKQAQARIAAGVAHGQTDHVGGRLLAVRIAQVAGQVDGVVQRDDGGARREPRAGRPRQSKDP